MPRLRWLLRLPEIVLVGLLVVMSTVVFMQVVFRYFLHFPLAWSEELARFLFVWVSLLGAAIGVKQRAHFGFGLLLHALPAGARRAALVAIDVAMLWFAYLLTATGLSGLQTALIQRSPVLNVSLAWVYAALPVSGALMMLYLIPQLIATLRGRETAGAHGRSDERALPASEVLAE